MEFILELLCKLNSIDDNQSLEILWYLYVIERVAGISITKTLDNVHIYIYLVGTKLISRKVHGIYMETIFPS